MLETLSIVLLVGGIFCFILALVLAVNWKILDIFDELSGRKAKRQIESLKKLNSGEEAINNLSTTAFMEAVNSGNIIPKSEILRDANNKKSKVELSTEVTETESINLEKSNTVSSSNIVVSDVMEVHEEDCITDVLSTPSDFAISINIIEEQTNLKTGGN